MYKKTSRALQHAHRVDKPLPTGGYLGADYDHDMIASAANMSMDECIAERTQLMMELTKAQNNLIASKGVGDKAAVEGLGHRIQGFVTRLSLVKKRLNALLKEQHDQAFGVAVFECVSAETWDRIIALKNKLIAENVDLVERRRKNEQGKA